MFEHIQRLRFYLYITLIGLPPALGCLWVLLARFEWVPPIPGLLWWFAVAVAPWWLLAVALLSVSRAGWGYAAHRLDPEIQHIEKEKKRRIPAPRLVREKGIVGGGALLLAAAVLVPRQTPDGVLIWESSKIERQTVMGTIRQEEGRMAWDTAEQRVWTCHYLTTLGISTRVHVASRGFPYCSYFIYRYPRS